MIINRGNLETIFRAFSTAFQDGFGSAMTDHGLLAMEHPSETSEEEYGWLGQFPGLREFVGERIIRSISHYGYSIRNKAFESTIGVNRDKIRDDRYGTFGMLFDEMGRAAAVHPTELCYEALKNGHQTLCYDGQYFFDTDHDVDGQSVSNSVAGTETPWYLLDLSRKIKPLIFQRREPYELLRMDSPDDEKAFMLREYRYGVFGRCNSGYGLWQLAHRSAQDLTPDNYAAARAAMLEMKGDQGRPIGVNPTHLVVPSTLEGKARKIIESALTTGGATNEWAGTAKVHTTPWL